MSNGSAIPYGEGWPWPKKEPRPGTVYRFYDDPVRDCTLLLAIDEDGTRRGVEVDGKLWCMVIRPREKFRAEGDFSTRLSGDEDWETLLQAPEAWSTKGKCKCGAEVGGSKCTGCAGPFIAWALFRTDPEADAFADLVSDHLLWPGIGPAGYDKADIDFEKLGMAREKVWERNERGWREKAMRRAEAMLRVIRDGEAPPESVPCPPHDSPLTK